MNAQADIDTVEKYLLISSRAIKALVKQAKDSNDFQAASHVYHKLQETVNALQIVEMMHKAY